MLLRWLIIKAALVTDALWNGLRSPTHFIQTAKLEMYQHLRNQSMRGPFLAFLSHPVPSAPGADSLLTYISVTPLLSMELIVIYTSVSEIRNRPTVLISLYHHMMPLFFWQLKVPILSCLINDYANCICSTIDIILSNQAGNVLHPLQIVQGARKWRI